MKPPNDLPQIFESDIYLNGRLSKLRINGDEWTSCIGSAFGVFVLLAVFSVPIGVIAGSFVGILMLSHQKTRRKNEFDNLLDRFSQAIDDIRSDRPHSHKVKTFPGRIVIEIHDTVRPFEMRHSEDAFKTALMRSLANQERNEWTMEPKTARALGLNIATEE